MSFYENMRSWERYLWVVLLTAGVLLTSLILEPLIEPDFSPLFLGAITVCTRLWGLRAGILCTALSAAALLFLFLPPHYSLVLWSWPVLFREFSFLGSTALIMWLVMRAVNAERRVTRTLEEIRASEERFRVALLKSPVIVFHQNADLRYTWVYNPGSELQGVPLVGKTDFDLFLPDEAARVTGIKRRVLAEGAGVREEHSVTVAGKTRVFDVTLEPFRDRHGQVTGVLGAAVDVTERKRVEEELRYSSEQLRSLAAYLQSMQETERALTAREIHDNVTQTLAALDLQLLTMVRTLSSGNDPAAVAESIRKVSSLLESTMERSERISSKLRSSVLDNLGLAAAIESHARAFESETGIRLVMGPLLETAPGPEVSTAIFRTFQEALQEVAQDGRATQVHVSVWAEGAHVFLRIRDDGKGIGEAEPSLALVGMREQVHSLGGTLSIRGGSEEGTTLCAAIPVLEAAADARPAKCPLVRGRAAGAAVTHCPIDGSRCLEP